MAGPDANLGTATVTVKVDTTEVKPALDQTQAEVTATTQKIGTDAEKNIGGGFSKSLDSMSRLRSMMGKLLWPVAIAVGITRVVNALREAVKEAERFQESMQDVGREVSQRLAATNQETDLQRQQVSLLQRHAEERERITDAIEAAAEAENSIFEVAKNKLVGLFTDAPATMAEKARAAAEQLSSLGEKQAQETEIFNRKAADARQRLNTETAAKIARENEQAEVDLLDGVARVEAARVLAMRDAQAAIDAADDEAVRAQLARRLDLIQRRFDAEAKAITDAAAAQAAADAEQARREESARKDRERKDRESAERTAKANADAFASAMSGAFDRLDARVSALNDSTSNTLEALLRRVEVFVDNQGYGR